MIVGRNVYTVMSARSSDSTSTSISDWLTGSIPPGSEAQHIQTGRTSVGSLNDLAAPLKLRAQTFRAWCWAKLIHFYLHNPTGRSFISQQTSYIVVRQLDLLPQAFSGTMVMIVTLREAGVQA